MRVKLPRHMLEPVAKVDQGTAKLVLDQFVDTGARGQRHLSEAIPTENVRKVGVPAINCHQLLLEPTNQSIIEEGGFSGMICRVKFGSY